MTPMLDLKTTGLKATLPRLKILELFQRGEHRHMTAEDVYRIALRENIDIGLATVYRVLTQFEQAGLLSRSHFEGGKAVYELDAVRVDVGHKPVQGLIDKGARAQDQHGSAKHGRQQPPVRVQAKLAGSGV
jgi:Fe2+ or Zn2+ uptake regulation protein